MLVKYIGNTPPPPAINIENDGELVADARDRNYGGYPKVDYYEKAMNNYCTNLDHSYPKLPDSLVTDKNRILYINPIDTVISEETLFGTPNGRSSQLFEIYSTTVRTSSQYRDKPNLKESVTFTLERDSFEPNSHCKINHIPKGRLRD
jgi:hypothetical protein